MDIERMRALAQAGDRKAAEHLWQEARRRSSLADAVLAAATLADGERLRVIAEEAWARGQHAHLETASRALGFVITPQDCARLDGMLKRAHGKRRSRRFSQGDVLDLILDALASDAGWAWKHAGTPPPKARTTVGLVACRPEQVVVGIAEGRADALHRVHDWKAYFKRNQKDDARREAMARWSKETGPARLALMRFETATCAEALTPEPDPLVSLEPWHLKAFEQSLGWRNLGRVAGEVAQWRDEASQKEGWHRLEEAARDWPDSARILPLHRVKGMPDALVEKVVWGVELRAGELSRLPDSLLFDSIRGVKLQGGGNPRPGPSDLDAIAERFAPLRLSCFAVHHAEGGEALWSALSRSPGIRNLERLELHETSEQTTRSLVQGALTLKHLVLHKLVDAEVWVEAITSDRLERLKISTGQYDKGSLELPRFLSSVPKTLKVLDLSHHHLGDAGLAQVCRCPALQNLEVLRLPRTGVTGAGLGEALEGVLPQLRTLELSGNAVGREGLEALVSTGHMERLEALMLANAGLDAEALISWARSISSAGLQALVLDESVRADGHLLNMVDNAVLQAIVESPLFETLEVLELRMLHRGGITGRGIQHMTKHRPTASLRHLDLGGHRIGISGAKALAHWPGLANLESLSLIRCKTGPAGREALRLSPFLKAEVTLGSEEGGGSVSPLERWTEA